MTPDPLPAFLAAARARVDAALERWIPTPPACPAIVSDAMRYSVFAGGKRLRPILTLAAAAAFEPQPEATAHPPVASAAALRSMRRCPPRAPSN